MTLMPAGVSFGEAAAVCDGAILALTYLRRSTVGREQRILVYGASGSIGTAAVQLAKHFGADVTAVCATDNIEVVRSLGADHVIDYTEQDFTRNGETYDLVSTRSANSPSSDADTRWNRTGSTPQPTSGRWPRTRSWRWSPS